ncbi:MAG: zinc-dependent alcohol dehydrogenase family protein [Proteobacteria bacterium]|nr:zinc-dependent alcohol dehydrogenase family protein [Pseudomonadota bacterium]
MKVIQLHEHGGPDLLTSGEIDDPVIQKPTEIKVRLKAAGINPIDTKLRAGLYPVENFPVILGCDGSGIIEELGSEVTHFKQGDEVFFFHGGVGGIQGNYAQFKVLDEHFIAHKPESIDFNVAAAAPLVLLTAWESLFDHAQIKQGQTVFINAGAGGVGHVAIQLAKHAGASVCTTISNDEKAAYVKRLGADYIINYKEQDVAEAVLEWTNGDGVDIVIDNIGSSEIQSAFSFIKHYGKIVTLLQPDKDIDWSLARFKNIQFHFEVMLSPLLFDLSEKQKHQTEILENCARLIDDGKLQVNVGKQFDLEYAAEAHRLIEEGHTTGKIVLTIV